MGVSWIADTMRRRCRRRRATVNAMQASRVQPSARPMLAKTGSLLLQSLSLSLPLPPLPL